MVVSVIVYNFITSMHEPLTWSGIRVSKSPSAAETAEELEMPGQLQLCTEISGQRLLWITGAEEPMTA